MPRASKAETEAKRQRALELKLHGKTWAQVAELTGYASASAACQAAGIVIAQRTRHTVDEYREQGLARLELLDHVLWEIINTRHRAVTYKGAAVDEDGNPLYDNLPRIKAIEALRRNEEVRARLTGTPAPTRTKLDVTEHDAVDQDIENLVKDLAGNDPASRPAAEWSPAL